MPGKKEFRDAAVVYVVLKLIMVAGTYAYVSCPECGPTTFMRQAIHLALFTHFIYAGMRITSATIGIICLVRGGAYLLNFFFKTTYLLYLPITGTTLTLMTESGAGNFFFLLNALVMFVIAGMIFRAVKARGFDRVEISKSAEVRAEA
jgi:uncharacterized membrane protein